MDLTEATSIVFNRIQQLEPDYVTKIIGCLLLRDRTNQEMIRLALGTDKSIQEAINNAKIDLGLASKSPSPPTSPPTTLRPEHPISFGPRNFKYSSLNPQLSGYNFDQLSRNQVQNQNPYLGFEDQVVASEYMAMRRRNPIKTCHYHNRGFCKHGDNCKYLHDESLPRRFSAALRSFSNNEDHDQIFPPESLEKLEIEIVDILKSRRGPISIASLPMIYLERYRKSLQAEGYLTESQRHGKTGHSLTRLLSRISSITLIDRPHGQHFIVLAEDASKYSENRHERGENSFINSKSRQIYLTFPAESPFTEQDVANYFSNFGAVEDVRIPCQNKRMFGFVTFLDSDTVQMILSKGNPHYICGARVLVKPYKEKSKLNDRKYHDKMESRFHYPQQYIDAESDFQSMPRAYETSKLLQYHKLMEIEVLRLAELDLARKNHHQSFSNNNINGLKVAEDRLNILSGQGFSYWFGVLNVENEKIRMVEKNEDDSQINLPESPFAAAIANTISNLI